MPDGGIVTTGPLQLALREGTKTFLIFDMDIRDTGCN